MGPLQRHHFERLGQPVDQRLGADHVAPGLEGQPDMTEMQLVRSVDDDDIQPRMSHEGRIVGIAVGDVEAPRHFGEQAGVGVADRDHMQFRMAVEALEQALAFAEPDDADVELPADLRVLAVPFHDSASLLYRALRQA